MYTHCRIKNNRVFREARVAKSKDQGGKRCVWVFSTEGKKPQKGGSPVWSCLQPLEPTHSILAN
jgi:hypothetical protein